MARAPHPPRTARARTEREACAAVSTASVSIAPSNSVIPSSSASADFLALRRHLRHAFERQDRHLVPGAPARCVRRRWRHFRRRSRPHACRGPARRRRLPAPGSRHRPSPKAGCNRVVAGASGTGADGEVHGVEPGAQAIEVFGCLHRFTAAHVDPESHDARDLAIEHGSREAIRRNAVAHESAELWTGFDQGDA